MESKDQSDWTVYLVECGDHTYYCGVCKKDRLENRIEEHNRGEGAKYTRARLPVKLQAHSGPLTKKDAYRLEYRIKQLPRPQKIPLLKSLGTNQS